MQVYQVYCTKRSLRPWAIRLIFNSFMDIDGISYTVLVFYVIFHFLPIQILK